MRYMHTLYITQTNLPRLVFCRRKRLPIFYFILFIELYATEEPVEMIKRKVRRISK